jgi:hypothetical protein
MIAGELKRAIFRRIKEFKVLASFKNQISSIRTEFKAGGFKGVFKKFGYKLFLIFFFYYLIRDLIIYVLVPYLVARVFI